MWISFSVGRVGTHRQMLLRKQKQYILGFSPFSLTTVERLMSV